MGLRVSPEALTGEWSLSFADIGFAKAKSAGSRLGLAVQLKFFAAYGYFATAAAEAPDEAVSYLAEQLGVSKADLCRYDFSGAFRAAPLRRDFAPSWFPPDEAGGSRHTCDLDSDGALP